ncbi:MAG TPA: cupin-like domain-containing protein [Rhizomicrobium sp.]|nr:cupin-like domain-containing protein [Rhizomicrobium sp.]
MPDVILKHVPGMKHASAVPVHRAEELSESVFTGEHVSNGKPCVIRGAVKHWAAVQNWRDKDHLKKRCGHHSVSLFSNEYHARWDRLSAGKREVSFTEAIDHLHAEETKIGIIVESLPELQMDLGRLPFLTKAEPAFTYEAARFFFYRNAGTSWHFHSFDETLMSQIVGSKKIGLLKTNTPSYLAMLTLFCKEEYYDDPSAFEGFDAADLEWFSAELDEGDALYIPPLWWHGVIPTTRTFGATAAVTWRSPSHVIANTIRQMASGEIDLIGMPNMTAIKALFGVAKKMGLEREFAIAWERRM